MSFRNLLSFNVRKKTERYLKLHQACFFTDFPAIQDNGVSLILSLEEKSLSLGRKSLSLEKKYRSLWGKSSSLGPLLHLAAYVCHIQSLFVE